MPRRPQNQKISDSKASSRDKDRILYYQHASAMAKGKLTYTSAKKLEVSKHVYQRAKKASLTNANAGMIAYQKMS